MPLAAGALRAGFDVLGFDYDGAKVDAVNRDEAEGSTSADVDGAAASPRRRLEATTNMARTHEADAAIICVPTPLNKHGTPVLDHVLAAIDAIATSLRPGQLVVLESTTYPGTTEEVLLPRLAQSGLRVGTDYFLAFAPERVDPGNEDFPLTRIPRVVGGVTPDCTDVACALYSQLVPEVVPVSSARAAEMTKLLENSFRTVNIALVNELTRICSRWDVNIWEVIEAAKTKPFGFMPFYPGPGVGGHCIPIDPVYLSWRARESAMESRLIDLATLINAQMPAYVVRRVADALNERRKSLKGSGILVLGIAYKPNVSDTRESPALDIITELQERGAVVEFSDPHVATVSVNGTALASIDLAKATLADADCVLIVTDHEGFDWELVAREASLVVDCRNALPTGANAHVVKL